MVSGILLIVLAISGRGRSGRFRPQAPIAGMPGSDLAVFRDMITLSDQQA